MLEYKYNLLTFLFNASPAFNQPLENVLLQVVLLLNLVIFFFIKNTFYVLFFFTTFVFLLGLFIGFYQMELFTGFLYVLEITAIFILLIVLFYFNFKGTSNEDVQRQPTSYYIILIGVFIGPTWYSEKEWFLPSSFVNYDLFDDYYEALNNSHTNDLIGLFTSYYFVNSYELLIVGTLLFLGSIACVVLFNLIGLTKASSRNTIKTTARFIINILDLYILRRQNLAKQSNTKPGLRVFKNKVI